METIGQRIKRLEAHIKDLMGWLQHYLDEGDYDMATQKCINLRSEIRILEHLKGEL